VFTLEKNLLEAGEVLVIHPEGTRRPGLPYEPRGAILSHLLKTLAEVQRDVPLVPLIIEYENVYQFRSAVILRVGEPMIARGIGHVEALEEHIRRYS
jgi:1-acyl-sn-glycerol-3-phosphate acyltransferase